MGELKFKINRYNQNGYPEFLPRADNGIRLTSDEGSNPFDSEASSETDPWNRKPPSRGTWAGGAGVYGASKAFSSSMDQPINQDYYSKSNYFRSAIEKQKNIEKGIDAASTAAAAVPGPGWAVAAGLQIGKGVGKATKDQYGIYKNRASQVVDNVVDPAKQVQSIENVFRHPGDTSNVINSLSMGIFGRDQSNTEAIKKRDLYVQQGITEAAGRAEVAGGNIRAGIGGYQAAPYGKKGMKLRMKTKYSKPC